MSEEELYKRAVPYLRNPSKSRYVTIDVMRSYPDRRWNYSALPFDDMIEILEEQDNEMLISMYASNHPDLTYELIIENDIPCSPYIIRRLAHLSYEQFESMLWFNRFYYTMASIAPAEEILANFDEPWDWRYIVLERGILVREFLPLARSKSIDIVPIMYIQGMISAQDVVDYSDYQPVSLGYRSGDMLILDAQPTGGFEGEFDIPYTTVELENKYVNDSMDLNYLIKYVKDKAGLYARYPQYRWRRGIVLTYEPDLFTPEDEDELDTLPPGAHKVLARRHPHLGAQFYMRINDDLLYAIAYGHYAHMGCGTFTDEPLLTYKEILTLKMRVELALD